MAVLILLCMNKKRLVGISKVVTVSLVIVVCSSIGFLAPRFELSNFLLSCLGPTELLTDKDACQFIKNDGSTQEDHTGVHCVKF